MAESRLCSLLFLVLLLCQYGIAQKKKGPSPEKEQRTFFAYVRNANLKHLITMTEELIKDMEYKLRHAGKFLDEFKHTADYELGYIAAHIQIKFKHMCEIYKIHTKMSAYIQQKFEIGQMMDANHIVQSDYHEILMLKDIFWGLVKKHSGSNRKDKIKMRMDQLKQEMIESQREALQEAQRMGVNMSSGEDSSQVVTPNLSDDKLEGGAKEYKNINVNTKTESTSAIDKNEARKIEWKANLPLDPVVDD